MSTQRYAFLAEMQALVPRARLVPRSSRTSAPAGRPSGLERMLSIPCGSTGSCPADAAREKALYESAALRAFAGTYHIPLHA